MVRVYKRKTDKPFPNQKKRVSRTYRANVQKCYKHRVQLGSDGVLLTIDPSSGSEASMPAVAVFKGGKLIWGETIFLPPGQPLCYRLSLLLERLIEIREKWNPDVVGCEFIPPKVNGSSAPSLRSAVGVVTAVFGKNPDRFLDIPAAAWQAQAKKQSPEGYEKSDLFDAVAIGLWILYTADLNPDYEGTYAELRKSLKCRGRQGTKRAARDVEYLPGGDEEEETITFLD